MEIHPLFIQEHQTLQNSIRALQTAIDANAASFAEAFGSFQSFFTKHLKKKDLYYNRLDRDRQVADRVLMHDLRNDHAAVVFTMESLAIRLRKNGLNPEWKQKWSSMVEVLLPHLKREEETLFPLASKKLTPEEWRSLENDIQALS